MKEKFLNEVVDFRIVEENEVLGGRLLRPNDLFFLDSSNRIVGYSNRIAKYEYEQHPVVDETLYYCEEVLINFIEYKEDTSNSYLDFVEHEIWVDPDELQDIFEGKNVYEIFDCFWFNR